MKIKYLPLVLLLAGVTAFGQKKEIKQAESAIENQDFAKAKALLEEAKSGLDGLNDKFKARYYTAMGTAIGMGGNGSLEEIDQAKDSFEKAIQYGNEQEGQQGLFALQQALVQSALKDQDAQKSAVASDKFYKAYEMSPTDTIYLFVAAGNAYNAKNDDLAIKYYKQLMDMGYRGDEVQYIAVKKDTEEEEVFGNKQDRDLFVKSGDYVNPSERRTARKDGDVVKTLAMAYVRKGDNDKALEVIKKARKANPDDLDLIMSQAMIYEQTGDKEEYKKILKDLIKNDAKNASGYYIILGDTALKEEDMEAAREYYGNAIKEDGSSVAAYNGMANTYLMLQESIVEEMNSLGMSKADTQKYNKLSEERNKLLENALPYMEKAVANDKENPDLLRTIYQIHSQLGNTDEAAEYKKQLDATQN